MNLQRLPIRRIDDEVLAIADGTPFDIVNPKDIPEGVKDGIFTVDRGNGTARFESRKAESRIKRVEGRKQEVPAPNYMRLRDGTLCLQLLDDRVSVTKNGNVVLVTGDELTDEMKTFIGALALEGLDLTAPAVSKALRYILEA